jgi:large subunit ribosomal protein L9
MGKLCFCSVTAQEVVDAIEQQTGRVLDKRSVVLPEIRETGTYNASIKLHPEVTGEFKLVIQREKNKG